MVSTLRKRMGRLGVLMTLLALLFAASPVLEAAACASEGCGLACLTQAESADASNPTDPASSDCADDGCLCAVGHCGQSAGIPAIADVTLAPISVAASASIAADALISADLQTLDRPPRF